MTASAMAGDVWVGNGLGEIDRHQPLGTQVVFPTLCTQVNAMVFQGSTLFLADAFGNIWKVNGETLNSEFFPQSFIATSLAIHNGDLIAGSADGNLRRIRTSDGAVMTTRLIGSTVDAITVDGDTIFIGGHDTFIRKGGAMTGAFTVIGACGGQVHSVAVKGNELLAAALDGKVYRINKATGQYITSWNLPAGIASPQVAVDGAFLVAGGSDGVLRWLNPVTGVVQFSASICSDIHAMAVQARCAADADRNGVLNANDFSAYLNVFGAGSPDADVDGSGTLNINDFMRFVNAYAVGCP
jgi:outer membrane protein assembly factor BamB